MQTYASLSRSTFVPRSCHLLGSFAAGNAPAHRSRPTKIFVPDLLARWPWLRRISPHYPAVAKESNDWIRSLGAFSPEAQHAFDLGYFSLLACMAYPGMKREHVRTGCDYMNMVFAVDEHTDASEPSEVVKQRDIVMGALRNPHKPRPKDEWIGGEVVRQFWELAIRTASKQSQKRYIAAFDDFMQGLTEQATDRRSRHIRDVDNYFAVRRKTIGTVPAFALLELPFDIPDDVMSHPTIREMELTATEMIILANDVASYNVEQCRGDDGHNIITIVMNQFGTDVNGAMIFAQDSHTKLEKRFLAAMAALPEWDEPLKSHVQEYCNGLANWVRANHDWNFENERYFGKRGLEIREKGWMDLMPRHRKPEVGPVLVDSSTL